MNYHARTMWFFPPVPALLDVVVPAPAHLEGPSNAIREGLVKRERCVLFARRIMAVDVTWSEHPALVREGRQKCREREKERDLI
jgi:hypothetical protein